MDIFKGTNIKTKSTTPTAVKSTVAPRSGGFDIFTKGSSRSRTQPTQQPEPAKQTQQFEAPIGGVKIGENKWKTPSGSIWEYLPDGTRKITLDKQFGGGVYLIDPKDPSRLINQGHTTYGGVEGKSGNERDDIIPVSLGGVNSDANNIRYEELLPESERQPGRLTKSDEYLQDVNKRYKSGQISLNQARLEIMRFKQDQAPGTPKTDTLSNLWGGLKDVAKSIFTASAESKLDTQKQIVNAVQPKPEQGMEFKVGENLNPEQQQQAKTTLIKSQISEQNRQALRESTGANAMDLKKTALDIFRAPVRGIVQITNPSDEIDPLTADPKYSKIMRFIYGDEPMKGYALQAAEAETSYKEKGFGGWATPLAVLQATGTAALDLAPVYAPLVSSANEAIAAAAERSGTKAVTLSYKDLQEITSGRLTSGEKFEAFKAVGNDPAFKSALKNFKEATVTKSEDTLLKRMANNPITNIGRATETTYSVVGAEPKAVQQVIKALPEGDPIRLEVEKAGGTKALTGKQEMLALPEGNPNVKYGDGFTMTEKVNKEIVAYNKALREVKEKYVNAITKFNEKPTSARMQSLLKARNSLSEFQKNNTPPWESSKPVPINSVAAVQAKEFPTKIEAPKLTPAPKIEAKPSKDETVTVPEKPVKVSGGDTPSKIAKSIESKSIEQGLTKGYGNLAGYDKITIKDQAEKAAQLFTDTNKALRVIKGEDPLPDGLRGTSVITAAEEHIKKTGDAKMAYELANSPLASETSAAAQELRLAAEREPDGIVANLKRIRETRESFIKKKYGSVSKAKAKVKAVIKNEVRKTTPKIQDWGDFIESIKC